MSNCKRFSTSMSFATWIGAVVCRGDHSGLFTISIARSVITPVMTHHSAGLNAPPKVSQRQIAAQIDVVQIHLAADDAWR